MAGKSILVCDDVRAEGKTDKLRSKILRKFAKDLSERMAITHRIITVAQIPKKLVMQNKSASRDPVVDTLYGHPVEVILQESEKSNVEMVVMGTRARSSFKRTFLGSVAEETIRNVKVPVVVLGAKAVEADFKLRQKGRLKILVVSGLDNASGKAERFAAQFAKTLSAEVMLFHSVGDPIRHMKDMLYSQRVNSVGLETIFDEMKEFAEVSVARKVKAYKNQGIQISAHIAYQETEVIKFLNKKDWFEADLIIMGSHSRSRMVKAFLGSSVRRAILSADRPVIVVRS